MGGGKTEETRLEIRGGKFRVGQVVVKEAVLRITLNLDGVPITSKSHTHPSHSKTSRLLTSFLLYVPVPQGTQCIRDM
jgi:hypothetical protein